MHVKESGDGAPQVTMHASATHWSNRTNPAGLFRPIPLHGLTTGTSSCSADNVATSCYNTLPAQPEPCQPSPLGNFSTLKTLLSINYAQKFMNSVYIHNIHCNSQPHLPYHCISFAVFRSLRQQQLLNTLRTLIIHEIYCYGALNIV